MIVEGRRLARLRRAIRVKFTSARLRTGGAELSRNRWPAESRGRLGGGAMGVKPGVSFDVCREVYRGAREVLETKRGILRTELEGHGTSCGGRIFARG
jgi:hypothetical protein